MTTEPQFRRRWPTCTYLGQIQVNGYCFDTYRTGAGSVLFAWGPEGYEYFCAPETEFPLPFTVVGGHEKRTAKSPPQTRAINAAWAEAKKRWWTTKNPASGEAG